MARTVERLAIAVTSALAAFAIAAGIGRGGNTATPRPISLPITGSSSTAQMWRAETETRSPASNARFSTGSQRMGGPSMVGTSTGSL